MTHNLIDPDDPEDRVREVHRVVIDVVSPAGADDPKLWDWDAIIDGRSALVSSTLIQGALSGEVQRFLDLAVEVDGQTTDAIELLAGERAQALRRGVELHGKLEQLRDEVEAFSETDPSADVSGVIDLVNATTDRLLSEVFRIDPKDQTS